MDSSAIRKLGEAREKILGQLSQVIVGQQQVIEELLISLFSRGHCLLEGVPGLAKTLMISTLSRTLNLTFSRIQFTPDLMPADITGTEIIEENRATGTRERRFLEGPLFSHTILADEINRTPPKTQAALLEAMQERQVTVGRVRHPLADPFFVLATQNPIEQEGTYPLPEAQQDRFMFKVYRGLPELRRGVRSRPPHDHAASRQRAAGADGRGNPRPAADGAASAGHRSRHSLRPGAGPADARRCARARPTSSRTWSRWGAGPRAVQFLILGGKARALLHGRTHVSTEDIQTLAKPVLRHRMVVNFAAESDGVTADEIIQRLIAITPTKEDELTSDARFKKIFAS